jgi:hypothetical protein
MSPVAVLRISDELAACADGIARSAAGVGIGVSMPEDHFALEGLIGEFDRCRAAFDESFAAGFRCAATRLAETTLTVMAVDQENPWRVAPPVVAFGSGGR